MIIDPNNFENFNRVLAGVVAPRPIAFVSTISDNGLVNLSPFSFFTEVAEEPPMILFASNTTDTLLNIRDTREFVVNFVSKSIADAMMLTSGEYPKDVNEFDVAGLTQVPSEKIIPPRVKESPVNIECKLDQIIELDADHDLILGEVVFLHIYDEMISGYHVNHKKLNPVSSLTGDKYCATSDVFELFRPKL